MASSSKNRTYKESTPEVGVGEGACDDAVRSASVTKGGMAITRDRFIATR